MDELFIYDRDKGLFKKVLEQSFVMEGRYHVTPDMGQDLNSNNLNTLVANIPEKKYPLCVCIAPRSNIVTQNGQQKEDFYFTLVFVCQTYKDQSNPRTRQSTHEIWYDWKDMKQAAEDFIAVLDDVTRKNKLASGLPIATQFNIDAGNVKVTRLSKFGEDRVSGVAISFMGTLNGNTCELNDYPADYLFKIQTPDEVIHPQHKH